MSNSLFPQQTKSLNVIGDTSGESTVQMRISDLVAFKDHPFKVKEDDALLALSESIEIFGVSTPILVRSKGRGAYEIIAGHRRVKACELLGLETIPAFIRDLDDEDAVFHMVDSNLQREELLFSEKAFAYKMKLDALKRKTGKADPNRQNEFKEKTSLEQLAKESEDSEKQIHRYIRLTKLKEGLLDLTDFKKIPFGVAVEISYLQISEQNEVESVMKALNVTPSLAQASNLKKCSKESPLTRSVIESILTPELKATPKVSVKFETGKYFPPETSKETITQVVLQLLEEWSQKQEAEKI